MSDLYLTLYRKLQEVDKWVRIDPAILREARERVGAREKVAARLHISTKTLERWEREGRFPQHMLDKIAQVLNLDIERPSARSLQIPLAGDGELAGIHQQLEDLGESMTRMERRFAELVELLGREDGRPSRRESS